MAMERAWQFGSDEISAELNRDAMPSQTEMDSEVADHFGLDWEQWEALSEDEQAEKREEAEEDWQREAESIWRTA